MKTALLVIVAIIVFFMILQELSDRTYKPTKEDLIAKLRQTIDGTIDPDTFDELLCVRIAYDPFLDEIRIRLNGILDGKDAINRPHRKTKTIDLTEIGKKRVAELVERLQNQPNQAL